MTLVLFALQTNAVVAEVTKVVTAAPSPFLIPVLSGFLGAVFAVVMRFLYEEIGKPWLIARRFQLQHAEQIHPLPRKQLASKGDVSVLFQNNSRFPVRNCGADILWEDTEHQRFEHGAVWLNGDVEADLYSGQSRHLKIFTLEPPPETPSSLPFSGFTPLGNVKAALRPGNANHTILLSEGNNYSFVLRSFANGMFYIEAKVSIKVESDTIVFFIHPIPVTIQGLFSRRLW